MFGVVLTNRELSAGFAMLAGPLAHVILVLLRHITYRKTLYLWDISWGYLCLGNPIVRVSMSEVVGRPLCCSFQSLFHVVAKVPGVFQQSTSRVLEVADSVHIFNLNCQANLWLNGECWTQYVNVFI